ncbi:hypothetical protein HA402_008625 [Bradysia odoriphaga]|nr:hypothetical protein HA402_008625 [Bradysia odoriphaga]
MGGSRSTSQETEAEPPTLLLSNSVGASLGASNTTIDSEYNSLGSIVSSDQRTLLPNHNGGGDSVKGYTNPTLSQTSTETSNTIPQSPPPSYEHVLEENRLANLDKDNNPASCTAILNGVVVGGGGTCFANLTDCSSQINLNENSSTSTKAEGDMIESPVYSFSTMTTPSHENLLLGNVGSCDPLFGVRCDEQIDLDERAESNECVNDEEVEQCSLSSDMNNESMEEWDSHDNQYQELHSPDTIINNKSTKAIYKAVAKQWGITCKMSEQCRCMECQSNYFDCEFDDNENHKTDGGLGAGTPMFISEVMHGSACVIL